MNQSEAQAIARHTGQAIYTWTCETHGQTDHSVKHGNCLMCFTKDGYRRKPGAYDTAPPNSARIAARRSGATSYPGQCDLHGDVQRSTIHGTCLQCYTSAGVPRSAKVNTLGVYIDKAGVVQVSPGA